MSRIDEALRRVSLGPLADRRRFSSTEDQAFSVDEFSAPDYPREQPASPSGNGVRWNEADRRAVLPMSAPVLSLGTPARVASVQTVSEDRLVIRGGPALVEQYRRLATALDAARSEHGLKIVLVTSAQPREGRTRTAIDLALTLGEFHGRRVLLIDADLRQPSVHERLGLRNEIGLGDVLQPGWDALPVIEASPLLTVLPSGQPKPNARAALTSDRMRELLDQCAPRFDWLLLDTPPVSFSPDAPLLARLTQAGVVFVIGGSTQFPVVGKAIAEFDRERIIGTVLSSVDTTTTPANADVR